MLNLSLLTAFFLVLVNFCRVNADINWNDNDWALNCDFKNNDMISKKTEASKCGPKCSSTSGCTHFAWTNYNGGTCWLKQGYASKSDAIKSRINGIVCGVTGSSPGEQTNKTPPGKTNSGIMNSCLDAFSKAALDRTNMYRARHHANKLTADAIIAKTAQDWANYLTENRLFKHNTDKLGKLGYGENIAYIGNGGKFGTSNSDCAESSRLFNQGYANKMIDMFYDEVKNEKYNYNGGADGKTFVAGHFTQLIWKGSSKVGHGLAFSTRPIDGFYRCTFVADYKGPGNVQGQYIENVKAP